MDNYRPALVTEAELKNFKREHTVLTEVDAFNRQIKELFFIDMHQYIGSEKTKIYASAVFKNYQNAKRDEYVYVYYPWNAHLVKTVRAEDYFTLITNRNQDLITADEQKLLAAYSVAVLGMSVGSNIAFVLAQAGISRRIILADFDELDTTNLNRILTGVHHVGLNKTVVAARKIYEGNPFAEVIIWPEGVHKKNLEAELKKGSIDCVIEEIDDIPFKVETRILAMKYKVPVVMITDNGSGVVLHVERYDLGHTKIWGRTPTDFLEKLAEGPMTKEKSGQIIMFDIVGGPEKVDAKMLSSVRRVLAKELVSWSQLGSAAVLGGVVVTDMIKKIALGETTELDIRSYISTYDIQHGTHSL